MNGSTQKCQSLSSAEELMGVPCGATVDLYVLPSFAVLHQSTNFMWKGGIFGIDKFCSIFMD